jgi:CRP-like cAMP-binding protein
MKPFSLEEFLQQQTVTKKVKRGEVLVKQGDTSVTAFYVEKGCLRSYITDNKGKEHILQFAPETWIISNNDVLVSDVISLTIDAIEDSVVRVVNRGQEVDENLLDMAGVISMNNKLRKHMSFLRKRILLLLSASAEERYDDFNQMYPNLANRVPQKMIASYLGITPESLSRVRKLRVTGNS